MENECLSKSNIELVKQILQLQEKMPQIDRASLHKKLVVFSEKNGNFLFNTKNKYYYEKMIKCLKAY